MLRGAAAIVLLLAVACTPATTPARTPSTTATASIAAIDVGEPGRPYDAAAILDAMRGSRRPGGVPDDVETDMTAGAIADAIWTIDGTPWATMAAGGSCGTTTCTVEIAGSHEGAAGEDLWVFEVTPSDSGVSVISAELGSVPEQLVNPLDAMVRRLVGTDAVENLAVASVRWMAPPQTGQFVLSYRSGGEERSCRADFTVDVRSGRLVADVVRNC